MIGNSRVVTFTPTQEFFAKGCYGIEGQYSIPTVGSNEKNDFLTNLFEKARANIEADNKTFAPQKEQYDTVMQTVNEIVSNISTVEEATAAITALESLEHALTIKKRSKCASCGKNKETWLYLRQKSKSYVTDGAHEEEK